LRFGQASTSNEKVMNLSQDPGAYDSYLQLTRTLRGIRHLLDQGDPGTELAPDDVQPGHPKWQQAYGNTCRLAKDSWTAH
jgi:hypothetical protein